MDKIEHHSWGTIFSDITQQEVFHNDRYVEVVAQFNEPGLALAQITTIHTPGIELVQINISTERKLVLVDPKSSEKVGSSFVIGGDMESRFTLNKTPVRHWLNTHGFQYTLDFGGNISLTTTSYRPSRFFTTIPTSKALPNQQG